MLKQRNERKLDMLLRKKEDDFKNLLNELSQRKIQFCEGEDCMKFEEKNLIPLLPPLENHMVSVAEDGSLEWPTAFCYPEYEMMEFQQKLSENATLFDCLVVVLEEFALDKLERYKIDTCNMYHENKKKHLTVKMDLDKTIKEIVSDER